LPPTTRAQPLTSGEFFAELPGGITSDLCFIDGIHLFECALRDFMNFKRCAAPSAVTVIDSIFPNHPAQAERACRTRAWTGVVWQLEKMLQRYRPDIFLLPSTQLLPGSFWCPGLTERTACGMPTTR
jgi:hypothetical protein